MEELQVLNQQSTVPVIGVNTNAEKIQFNCRVSFDCLNLRSNNLFTAETSTLSLPNHAEPIKFAFQLEKKIEMQGRTILQLKLRLVQARKRISILAKTVLMRLDSTIDDIMI